MVAQNAVARVQSLSSPKLYRRNGQLVEEMVRSDLDLLQAREDGRPR